SIVLLHAKPTASGGAHEVGRTSPEFIWRSYLALTASSEGARALICRYDFLLNRRATSNTPPTAAAAGSPNPKSGAGTATAFAIAGVAAINTQMVPNTTRISSPLNFFEQTGNEQHGAYGYCRW